MEHLWCLSYYIPRSRRRGAADAMIEAIDEAGIERNEVSYINAHGTSTPLNDKYETYAIKTVFERWDNIPISSTKSMTGHLLGGAGAIEAIVCVKALQEGFYTSNYRIWNSRWGIRFRLCT